MWIRIVSGHLKFERLSLLNRSLLTEATMMSERSFANGGPYFEQVKVTNHFLTMEDQTAK